jgi:hypothetical protein
MAKSWQIAIVGPASGQAANEPIVMFVTACVIEMPDEVRDLPGSNRLMSKGRWARPDAQD